MPVYCSNPYLYLLLISRPVAFVSASSSPNSTVLSLLTAPEEEEEEPLSGSHIRVLFSAAAANCLPAFFVTLCTARLHRVLTAAHLLRSPYQDTRDST